MLQRKLINEVNVNGTENIIKVYIIFISNPQACIENNINSLVYTSTYNVVFGGQVCDNLDESLDYFPVEKHPDEYSRTKAIAEMKIRNANGNALTNGGKLATCAVRYLLTSSLLQSGQLLSMVKERRGISQGFKSHSHLNKFRIVRYAEQGLLCFTVGNATVDWVHVDNLVHAHLLAGAKLLRDNVNSIVAGKAYFISDQSPVKNFEFFRPLLKAIEVPYPILNLPVWLMYYIGIIVGKSFY